MVFSTIYVSKDGSLGKRVFLLVIIGMIVRSGEKMNAYGSKNWEIFATQNYFDKNGVFFTIMVSFPLLIIVFGMLISYLREASTLLVEVKRRELKQKAASKKKRKKVQKQD